MNAGYALNQISSGLHNAAKGNGLRYRITAKPLYKIVSILILWVLITLLCSNMANAHRPHDDIRDVAMSPEFSRDGTAFIIFFNDMALKRTTDFGDSWKWMSNGLDYVYPLTSVSVSPNFEKDGTVFVSSQGDGVYSSYDRGNTWTKRNKGLGSLKIRKIMISSNFITDGVALAADVSGNLYITRDKGQAWKLFYECETEITTAAILPIERDIEIVIGDRSGFLHRYSNNRWSKMSVTPNSGVITAIAVSPNYTIDRTLWVGTEKRGVLKSLNGGDSFRQESSALNDKNITTLKLHLNRVGGISLFATTWYEALFRSDDGGRSWLKLDRGLSTEPQANYPSFLRPHFRGIGVSESYLLVGGFDGLFLSKDGGEAWRQLETWPVKSISLLSVSPVIEGNRQSGILAYGGGAYFIPDIDSKDWVKDAESLTLAGVRGRRTDGGVSDVVFSPSYAMDNTIFVASEHEIIKTIDGGKNWSRINIKWPFERRVRRKLNHYMRRMGISSDHRLKILGFFPDVPGWGTHIAISPSYIEDGIVFFGTTGIGQCLSVDRGNSCAVVFNTTNQVTTSMAISPIFKDDKSLFIGIDNRRVLRGKQKKGIYLTDDGGDTFEKSDQGVDIAGKIMVVISPDYNNDHILFAGTGAGLFITKDGAKTWARTGKKGLPDDANIIFLAFSPNYRNDQTLMVAVRGKGIFTSTDGGDSFLSIGSDLINNNEQLKMIRFSNRYAQDKTIYGVSTENVFRSSNGGHSWQLVQRPVRYEDARDVVVREGNWETVVGPQYSDSSITRSKVGGDRATLRFLGSGIRWISEKGPDGGSAKVFVDDQFMEEVSLADTTYRSEYEVFSLSGLSAGAHDIVIEISSNGLNEGWVAVDAFEILP